MAILALSLLGLAGLGCAASSNPKRGLVFTPNPQHPEDNKLWVQSDSDLTWYYNYGNRPSPAYVSVEQDKFEFIPMMWGVGENANDTKWLDELKEVMSSTDRNFTHVMGFNEPDAPFDWGGSMVEPRKAAYAWVANLEPLAEMGFKLGLPACTGRPEGTEWLKQFTHNCSQIVSQGGKEKNCTWDFLPVHWYDNFGGLKSHINERRQIWPDTPIWITEYTYAHQDLSATQQFYTDSAAFFDNSDFVGRYSYFGAFRAENSSVGPNAAFLNNAGKLTDIGSQYMGQGTTGVLPESRAASSLVPSPGVAQAIALTSSLVLAALL